MYFVSMKARSSINAQIMHQADSDKKINKNKEQKENCNKQPKEKK